MQVAFPDGWGPWVSRTGKTNGLLMNFIPGCLGALQTTLNKDEVCWKTASQVGKSSEHTGVDHWPAPYPLTVQPSDLATALLAAEPENHSSQFK